MKPYREYEPGASDLETAALHDIVTRMRQFRRRVALPTLIAATVLAWLGMAAHALGYWSVIGAADGAYYIVSAVTVAIAGALCAAPIIVPGLLIYVALRARLRRAWREQHRRNGVSEEWLEHNSRRFV